MLGGAGLVMFGMVAATGIRILSGVDFKNNRNNLFIVAISIGFGMIPLVAPHLQAQMPHALHPLLESGILLAALMAVVLNLYLQRHGLGRRGAGRRRRHGPGTGGGALMDPYLQEWGGLLLRWLHVLAGMAWIGTSFYFMHIDAMMKADHDIPGGRGGQMWQVHGGGFYHIQKYLVAPAAMPRRPDLVQMGILRDLAVRLRAAVRGLLRRRRPLPDRPGGAGDSGRRRPRIGIGALVLGWVVYDQLCKSRLGKNEVLLAAICFGFVMLLALFFHAGLHRPRRLPASRRDLGDHHGRPTSPWSSSPTSSKSSPR